MAKIQNDKKSGRGNKTYNICNGESIEDQLERNNIKYDKYDMLRDNMQQNIVKKNNIIKKEHQENYQFDEASNKWM